MASENRPIVLDREFGFGIWLGQPPDMDSICLGSGDTFDEALADARSELARANVALEGLRPSAGASTLIRTDYTREELVAICERAVVPLDKWRNRDSPTAHEQLGQCWVLLKSGCPFSVAPTQPAGREHGCYTDDRTIWVRVQWPDFNDFEYGTTNRPSNSETFYLPTPARLDESIGKDWY